MRETEGSRFNSSKLKTSGRSTRPWIINRCPAGSIFGTPAWCRSKCKEDGVRIPHESASGVPLDATSGVGVSGSVRLAVSNAERSPYALTGLPNWLSSASATGASCLHPASPAPKAAVNPSHRRLPIAESSLMLFPPGIRSIVLKKEGRSRNARGLPDATRGPHRGQTPGTFAILEQELLQEGISPCRHRYDRNIADVSIRNPACPSAFSPVSRQKPAKRQGQKNRGPREEL